MKRFIGFVFVFVLMLAFARANHVEAKKQTIQAGYSVGTCHTPMNINSEMVQADFVLPQTGGVYLAPVSINWVDAATLVLERPPDVIVANSTKIQINSYRNANDDTRFRALLLTKEFDFSYNKFI